MESEVFRKKNMYEVFRGSAAEVSWKELMMNNRKILELYFLCLACVVGQARNQGAAGKVHQH